MAESYEKRIEAAVQARDELVARRDTNYPGSAEWESLNASVREWDRVIEDLRRGQAS